MPYNVCLNEVGDAHLAGLSGTIQSRLQQWFSQIVAGTGYGTAAVRWVSSPPALIGEHELLVYFCLGQMNSVIRSRLLPGASGDEDGLTVISNRATASEVYVNGADGRAAMDCVPEIALHELMHNKLGLRDSLHKRTGLAMRQVGRGTPNDPSNITDMRVALLNSHRQWLGGFDGDALQGL